MVLPGLLSCWVSAQCECSGTAFANMMQDEVGARGAVCVWLRVHMAGCACALPDADRHPVRTGRQQGRPLPWAGRALVEHIQLLVH